MNIKNKIAVSLATGIAVVASVAIALPALANTSAPAPLNANVRVQMMGGRSEDRDTPNGRTGYASTTGRMMGDRDRDGDDDNGMKDNDWMRSASSTMAVFGNGQPVIAGTVSTISSSTLTITTASNVTYTVDVSNAKVLKGQSTVALSSVAVGDKVVIQGTMNGTSVIASTVMDQSVRADMHIPSGQAKKVGFFGGIGQFFLHLFGF